MAKWNNTVEYELNSSMDWDFGGFSTLPPGEPVWVLAEEDTCEPTQIPSIFRVIYDPSREPSQKVRMLDYDLEKQEAVLSGNNWHIVAWRRMTHHAGTHDRYFKEQGVSERSNWTMTLDRGLPDPSIAQ